MNPALVICVVMAIMILTLVFTCALFASTKSSNTIDMEAIKQIESGGNPRAENKKSGALGLYQITAICLQEFNQRNGTRYTRQDLFNPVINEAIAKWYLFNRIPQMLKHFNCEVNDRNIITAYNAGISFVLKGKMPQETVHYWEKYREIARR